MRQSIKLYLLLTLLIALSYCEDFQTEQKQLIEETANNDDSLSFDPKRQAQQARIQQQKYKKVLEQQIKRRQKLLEERKQQKQKANFIELILLIVLMASCVVLILSIILCCFLIRRANRQEKLLAELQARQNPTNIFEITQNDLMPVNWIKMSTEQNQEFNMATTEAVCSVCSSVNRSCDTSTECYHFFHIDCLEHFMEQNAKCPNCENKRNQIRNLRISFYCPDCSSFITYFPTVRNFLAFAKFGPKVCSNCQVNAKLNKQEEQQQNSNQCEDPESIQNASKQTTQYLVKQKREI